MKNNIDVILFDLGGVLIELGQGPFPTDWFPDDEGYSLKQWFHSKIGQDFERGKLSAEEFGKAIRDDLHLDATVPEILKAFTQWPIGLYAGADELLNTLNQTYTLAVLSNINELHWPRVTHEFNLLRYTDHLFASHLLQLAKPEKAAFEAVLSTLNVNASSVLFYDDNADNIKAALELGINAYLVNGIDEVRESVIKLDLIDAL